MLTPLLIGYYILICVLSIKPYLINLRIGFKIYCILICANIAKMPLNISDLQYMLNQVISFFCQPLSQHCGLCEYPEMVLTHRSVSPFWHHFPSLRQPLVSSHISSVHHLYQFLSEICASGSIPCEYWFKFQERVHVNLQINRVSTGPGKPLKLKWGPWTREKACNFFNINQKPIKLEIEIWKMFEFKL